MPCFDGMLPSGALSLADQHVYSGAACFDSDYECFSVLRAVINAADLAAFMLFLLILEVFSHEKEL